MGGAHTATDRERSVLVNIMGTEYPIRADADGTYIREVAAKLDAEMRKVHQSEPSRPPLKIAVLTALNLMHEVESLRREQREIVEKYENRAREIDEYLSRGLAE
jgi:cell division protein ZapA